MDMLLFVVLYSLFSMEQGLSIGLLFEFPVIEGCCFILSMHYDTPITYMSGTSNTVMQFSISDIATPENKTLLHTTQY